MENRRKSIVCVGCVVVVAVIIGAVVWSVPVSAQERLPGFSKGLAFGGARLSDGEYGTGFTGRVFLEYAPFIHEIGLRLAGGYWRFEDVISLGTRPFDSEERVLFENMYGTLGLVYRFTRGKYVPFAMAGLGIYHYQKEDVFPASGPIINGVQSSPFDVVRQREGNDFGISLGGGLEYFADEDMSMSVEVLLHSVQGEVNSEIFDVMLAFRFLPKK
jgi:hypothetical protein